MTLESDKLLGELSDLFEVQSADVSLGPYAEIVNAEPFDVDAYSKVDLADMARVADLLCPQGKLQFGYDDAGIDWRFGLQSLCNPNGGGNVSVAASRYVDRCANLFKRWRDLDEDVAIGPTHQEERLNSDDLFAATLLAPDLPIVDREHLSSNYLAKVLKPYAMAKYQIRQMLWSELQAGHERGLWLCFVPDDIGNFGLLPPGVGLDRKGSYQIDRATFLEGLGEAEEHVDTLNYLPHLPYPDQNRWHLIGADHPIIRWMIDQESVPLELEARNHKPPNENKGPGRRIGAKFYHEDTALAQRGLFLFRSRQVPTYAAAARRAIEEIETPLPRGYDLDNTLRRVREDISKLDKSTS